MTDPILQMSAELAKAHISLNPMEPAQVPALIESIYTTLKRLSDVSAEAAGDPKAPPPSSEPATPSDRRGEPPVINRSIDDPAFRGLDPWLAARISRKVAQKLDPGSSVHPTVHPDHLICLQDGSKVKLLRPYLKKRFGLTFAEYCDRWNLPDDYPPAPPSYTAAKRAAAKATGLGTTTRAPRGARKPRDPESKKNTARG